MNILFLSTENPYPPDHGHHIRTLNVLKGLAARHDIYFIGFAKTSAELQHVEDLQRLCKSVDIFMLSASRGLRLFWGLFLNLFSRLPFIVQRYHRPAARRRIQQLLKTTRIDLVHVDLLHVSLYHRDVNGLPAVLVEHNVESLRLKRRLNTEQNIFARMYLYLQYVKLQRYETRICPKFDRCVAVSETDRRYLIELTAQNNFVTLPNGVDVAYFAVNGVMPRPNSLVWVGSMASPYNADAVDYFLRDVLPRIRRKNPEVQVTFVGAEPTRLLREQAGKNKNIKIAGYVDDVRPYMREAAVFIAPMRCGSGTNLKILNALSMGMPVVTTPIGAEGLDVKDGKNIMVAQNAEGFAEKTLLLLDEPVLARSLGVAGRRVVTERYDWKHLHRETDRLYTQLVEAKRATHAHARGGNDLKEEEEAVIC